MVSQELGNTRKEGCCTLEGGSPHECCFLSPPPWHAVRRQDGETTVTTALLWFRLRTHVSAFPTWGFVFQRWSSYSYTFAYNSRNAKSCLQKVSFPPCNLRNYYLATFWWSDKVCHWCAAVLKVDFWNPCLLPLKIRPSLFFQDFKNFLSHHFILWTTTQNTP